MDMQGQILKQKIEILNGDRGDKTEAAARMKHIRALIELLPVDPSSKPAAGAAPTAAEFNALVKDVQQLFTAFNKLRQLLR